MKKFTRFRTLFFALTALALLNSCGKGSAYWEGDSTTEEDKMAEKVCECLYKTYKAKGVDADKLAASLPEMARDKSKMKEDEFNKKYTTEMAELKKIEAIQMDTTECGKKLSADMEKMITDKKIDGAKYHESLVSKCKLTSM